MPDSFLKFNFSDWVVSKKHVLGIQIWLFPNTLVWNETWNGHPRKSVNYFDKKFVSVYDMVVRPFLQEGFRRQQYYYFCATWVFPCQVYSAKMLTVSNIKSCSRWFKNYVFIVGTFRKLSFGTCSNGNTAWTFEICLHVFFLH